MPSPTTPTDDNIFETTEFADKIKKLRAAGKIKLPQIEYHTLNQPGVTMNPTVTLEATENNFTKKFSAVVNSKSNSNPSDKTNFAKPESPKALVFPPSETLPKITDLTSSTSLNVVGLMPTTNSSHKANPTETGSPEVLSNLITAITSYQKQRKEVTAEYYHQWLPHFFQKSRTSKLESTEMLLKALTALGKGETAPDIDLQKYQDVIRNGELGRTLRTPIKEGKFDALFGKKITTVSEFIKELEDSVKEQNSPKSMV